MVEAIGAGLPHKELAKVGILEHAAKTCQALPQDLLSVGHKEHACPTPARIPPAEVAVVEGRDDGLARARCCHDEVVPVVADLALCPQSVEDLLLKGVRCDIKRVGDPFRAGIRAPMALPVDRTLKALQVVCRILLELG